MSLFPPDPSSTPADESPAANAKAVAPAANNTTADNNATTDIVRRLQQRVRQIESSHSTSLAGPTASSASQDSAAQRGSASYGQRSPSSLVNIVSSTCEPLDRLLPAGGFRRGTLVEWLSASPGSGTGTLAMLIAREAAIEGGVVVIIDSAGWFYPPAAAALGIDLDRMIIVRPNTVRDVIWSLDQSLRCPGVAAVWAPLNDQVDQRDFRRLQLAAESGATLGLLLRPTTVRGKPTWSDIQLLVEPCPVHSSSTSETGQHIPHSHIPHSRYVRIQLARCRGQLQPDATLDVEIHDNCGSLTARPANTASQSSRSIELVKAESAKQEPGSWEKERLG